MAYEPSVVSAIKREIQRKKASPRVAKALTLAGITESGLQQSKYSKVGSGDRDSVGFLQQRPSQGWGPAGESAATDADQFLAAAIKANKGFHGSAGQLAQAVQRSAYPGRYDQHSAEANRILQGVLGSTQAPRDANVSLHASQLGASPGMSPATSQAPSIVDVIAQYNAATQPGSADPLSPDHLNEQLQQSQGMLMSAINRQQPTQALAAKGGGLGTIAGVETYNSTPGHMGKVKHGDPVAGGTSVSGVHETMGLPGYPARDYFAKAGSVTVAPVSGRVIRLSGHDPKNGPTNGPHGPLGWSVYIQGSDGRTYFLTHMGSRTVKVGQTLKAGEPIGTVANYDKYGTPSHIHMGVKGGRK